MENYTPGEVLGILCALLMAAAGAVNVLGSALEKIVKAYKAAKAPNDRQDTRLDKMENELKEVHKYLEIDKRRLDDQDKSNRITQRALLALLSHGIDGNHVEQMETAKEELQAHLINR